MATQHYPDSTVDPRAHLRYFLSAESICMGQGFQWCCAIRNNAGSGPDLVRHQRTFECGR